MDDGELRVRLAPDAAMRRIEGALNRPPKRILGLKVSSEFVGVVQGRRFEVWERRRHAVHMLGEVSGERDGSRIALRSGLTLRARILIGLFFILFGIVAIGLAGLPGERVLPAAAPFAGLAGGLGAAAIFYAAMRSQRAALRGFVRGVFEDVAAG
jgi:hypothetical protein